MSEGRGMTYRDAGVDIDAGDELVERIKPLVARTRRPEVLAGIGGFGALVELPAGYRRPVLVAGTDGVGTKLRLAIDAGRHDTIGIDLVAMCANDIAVQGAEPLFFLDYYATGKLRVDVAEAVVRGIVEGCAQAGAAFVGGETAEMPGIYYGEDYDLAGFCVGVVEKDRIIDGRAVRAGDAVIGLASSGPHSNGYSLIRKLVALSGAGGDTQLDGKPLLDRLLAPTRIYVKPLLALARAARGARAGPHHRRRPDGQHPARAAGGSGSGPRAAPLAPRSGLRLAAAGRTHRAGGDVPHLQLRHRHGRRRAAASRRRGRWSCSPRSGESAQIIGEIRPGSRGVVITE